MGSQADTSGISGLPQPTLTKIQSDISLLEPLSRKGSGPGIILLTGPGGDSIEIKNGVPSAFVKWAEEGYTVVQIGKSAFVESTSPIRTAIDILSECPKCSSAERMGLVAYEPDLWNLVAPELSSIPQIVAVSVYANATSANELAKSPVPAIFHLGGKLSGKPTRSSDLTLHEYSNVASHLFATPFANGFDYPAEGISHTRNLTHLKRAMDGPYFDLEAIWEEHTYYEFADRNVEKTMATMVAEPYVNHIPSLTGGIGRDKLTGFYAHHFVFTNPKDTNLELISRTVGIDRVIDEFIFKFTHDKEVDWLVPGIPPTHKKVEVPFTAVVNIRGDRLYHEHIAWDQASVLKQLGLLPDFLPFPHKDMKGQGPAAGKKFEYRLPVLGVQTANKMRDKNSEPSNAMFEYGLREVDA